MTLLILVPLLLERIGDFAGLHLAPEDTASWGNAISGITLFVLLAMVASMYYILPNIRQPWLAVLPGAILTIALWLAAARLLSLYLSRFKQVNLIYGSLGGIIAALLFFYVSNIIFIYGAELNYLLERASRRTYRTARTRSARTQGQNLGQLTVS